MERFLRQQAASDFQDLVPNNLRTSGFCNNPSASEFLNVSAGSGGPSGCATGAPSSAGVVGGTCAGYAKPSWQSVFGNPTDGVRDLPDVSLFAARGPSKHSYVVCYSDVANGGQPCNGTPDTWYVSGGTSFSSPIMAGLQALINQATGSRSGNPNPTYYSLAASEYGATGNSSCNSTLGNAVASSCIFYDVTGGDTDVPCQGTVNCYLPSGTYGVLSSSNTGYKPTYAASTGWDFATGIGTVNAYNLVQAILNPVMTLSVTTLSFSGQLLGTTSAAKTVKLTNGGGSPLVITSIASSGNFANSYNCPISPATVAPSGSCAITVRFQPSAPGTTSGEITITDNAGGSPHLVNLSGTGLTAVSLSPTALSFGTVIVGTTSIAKPVTLTNNLGTALTIGFSANGDYAVAGSGTTPCTSGGSLAGKAKCTMSLTFSPKQNGSINGALTVTYNSTFSPRVVALSGIGSGGPSSPLTFSPTSLFFSAQLIGTTSASKTVIVTNASGSAVNISGISASGNYTAVGAGTTPCGGSLAAGAKCTIAVTFSPTINGTITGSVAIANSSAVNPQIYNLSGTAVLPVRFSPTSITFAPQTVGTTSPPKTVTLYNAQNIAVGISGIVASGDYSVSTSVTNGCGSSVPAFGSCNL